MVDRINGLLSEMREMIDNIAHDMRSPIGRIRAISEDALINARQVPEYCEALEKTLGECDRLLAMINTTLDIAEVEAGALVCSSSQVDLREVTREACELFEPVAQARSLNFETQLEARCMIHGNLSNLQRMNANLIDNAIKYTPPKGPVSVQLLSDGECCRIRVADTGAGISASDQLRVFERFYRCDNSRSEPGCGLGLSFSRAVARQHGGDIELETESVFRTIFTVTLPDPFQPPLQTE
jgi:signal transduction histidine kinase